MGSYARSKGIHTYESFEAVLADPKVDVVVCATPNDVHKDIVVRSLKAGKNIVCEKPVEMGVEALDRMIATANESGKLFTVHQNRRWDVDFLGMKKIIEDGDIGEVINIESRIHGSRGIHSDWRCHKPYGGGMILDWGACILLTRCCSLLQAKLILFPVPALITLPQVRRVMKVMETAFTSDAINDAPVKFDEKA